MRAALAGRVRTAVAEVVGKQAEAGVDLINDGELSQAELRHLYQGPPRRLRRHRQHLCLPGSRRVSAAGAARVRRPGPLATEDPGLQRPDQRARCGRRARRRRQPQGRAGPSDGGRRISERGLARGGVAVLPQRPLRGLRHLFYAIAEAMRDEYETVAKAGIVLQLDCPDLGMGRHIQYAALDLAEFRKRIGLHIAALNHATRNIAPEQLRLHLCWGNYEGPHHYDVPLTDIIDIVFGARPAAISLEAANPRHAHEWKVFENRQAARRQAPDPGRDRIEVEFHRTSRIDRAAHRPLCQAGRPRERDRGLDCGYGTWVGQAAVDPDVVWAKFAAMAEGARIASRQFWT